MGHYSWCYHVLGVNINWVNILGVIDMSVIIFGLLLLWLLFWVIIIGVSIIWVIIRVIISGVIISVVIIMCVITNGVIMYWGY